MGKGLEASRAKERSQDNFFRQIMKFIQSDTEVPGKIQVDQGLQEEAQTRQAKTAAIGPARSASKEITDKGKLYGWYHRCHFTLPKKFAGKNMGKRIVKTLISKGKTDKLTVCL